MQPGHLSPTITKYHQRNPLKTVTFLQFVLIFAFASSTSSGQHVTIKLSDDTVFSKALLGEMDGDSVTIQRGAVFQEIDLNQIHSIQVHH